MRITHLGHACLLVDCSGTRLLIDPGNLAGDLSSAQNLDAILITHQHPDHLDPARFPALLSANPKARLLAETETAAMLPTLVDRSDVEPMAPGATATIGALTVTGVGSRHALIHDRVPRIGNSGFLVTAPHEPSLFHPGDAYEFQPSTAVDILALPLCAPWTAIADTLAFLRRIDPRWLIPIHDGIVSPPGRGLYLSHVTQFGPDRTEVVDLAGSGTFDFSADG